MVGNQMRKGRFLTSHHCPTWETGGDRVGFNFSILLTWEVEREAADMG